MTPSPASASESWSSASCNHLLFVFSEQDDDANTLSEAIHLAKRWNARLSVLGVRDMPPELERIAAALNASRSDIEDKIKAELRDALMQMIETCAPDQAPEVTVALGKPFIEIIRHVRAAGADMVVKTAEELHGFQRFLFGSTDQHLLRKCPCPVWLRVPDTASPITTVLAAVDVDDSSTSEPETQARLNEQIMMAACRVAAPFGAEVHILHAWDAPGEGMIRMWSDKDDAIDAVNEYIMGLRTAHHQNLDRLLTGAQTYAQQTLNADIEFTAHLEQGPARTVIPAQVSLLKASVLVMGTIARTGVPGFIIGNTAEDILNSVQCSVVTVKPPSYVSPLLV